MLEPEALTARTDRAVAAATAAGLEFGLRVDDARVLYDVFSVVVHLAPSPVVVRVPVVLPQALRRDPESQAAQQVRELAVADWLHRHGHPVVPPSPLVPRRPVRGDGYSMTFWQFVEQLPDAALDWTDGAVVTARLHARLRDYPGELDFMMPLGDYVSDGIDQLTDRPDLLAPDDLDRARREWQLLRPLTSPDTFAETFPDATVHPIHGDAPVYNIIVTPDGPLSSDFEHVTIGPPEWDLAGAGPDAVAAYDKIAPTLGLRTIDPRLLTVMEAARAMQLVACLPLAPELPGLLDGLKPFIDQWRAAPLAGGLESR